MRKDVPDGWSERDIDALREACKAEGCPICTLVQGAVQHYIDTWKYEGFSDVEHRHQLIQSRGFCPLHTWQLGRGDNAAQLALVYREVLTDVLEDLDTEAGKQVPVAGERGEKRGESAWGNFWKKWRSPRPVKPAYEQCPICRIRAIAEGRFVGMLVEYLHGEEVRELLCQSTGLCLLHFEQAHNLAEARSPQTLRYLFECQRTCMQRVLGEVQELIRKHDYRFLNEQHGEEMTSWRRAAELCAGNPGVY
ncbi:MAG TPA: DUF6062 family protein [Ktedonobacteraceae bacterium]|nr:DUF6062 family protein [Ktedonobacteraceae bacterium]